MAARDAAADVDPVASAGGPVEVPTLAEWALVLLSLLVALLGLRSSRFAVSRRPGR